MIHRFDNGLRLVYDHRRSPVVYVGIMIGRGTRDESTTLNGIAHYVEHTVFKGTQHHTAQQIISQIEGFGGEINAYTTKEETTFYAIVPNNHFAQTLKLLCEMVTQPTFPKKETEKELSVILDEIESYNDSPSELIYDDFENILFSGHPIAQRILGTKKTLKKIASDDKYPAEWVKKHFIPQNMVVFISGSITQQKALAQVEKMLPFFENTHAPSQRTAPTLPPQQHLSYQKHTHQVHTMIGAHAYCYADDKQNKLHLLNNILGGGSLNSRLNISLREKRGLVYAVESQYAPLSDTGYWSVYFACDAHDHEQCMDLVKNELQTLCNQKISENALHKAIVQLHGQLAIAAENREMQTLAMAKQVLYYHEVIPWQQRFEQIAHTTADELLEIANEVYNPNNLFILTYQ